MKREERERETQRNEREVRGERKTVRVEGRGRDRVKGERRDSGRRERDS